MHRPPHDPRLCAADDCGCCCQLAVFTGGAAHWALLVLTGIACGMPAAAASGGAIGGAAGGAPVMNMGETYCMGWRSCCCVCCCGPPESTYPGGSGMPPVGCGAAADGAGARVYGCDGCAYCV